jgi:hypothetical protein
MKHFIVTLLVGFWLLGPHAFADVNAKNGISITTASTINGKTPNSAFNGLTIVSGGGGGPALVSNVAANLGINGGTTGDIVTTGANLMVVSASWYSAASADVTLTDSKSNTWTPLTTRTSTFISNRLYYCYGGTVGSGHNFTLSGTAVYCSVQVIAFSGMASTPLDQQNGTGSGGAWTTVQPGSITPSQANTVVFVGLSFEANSSGAISIDGGYTISNTTAHSPGSGEGGSLAYQIFASASAQNPTWTSASSSGDGATTIASFKY